jgi:hypothetical protein
LLSQYPKVEYIDLDCGQTEFGPPGLISVTAVTSAVCGAPFTHGRPPVDARYVGSASPKGDPVGYFDSVADLLNRQRERCATTGEHCPVIINTNGWVKGLGLQLLIDTVRAASPDIVVQIETSIGGRNLPALSPLPQTGLDLWPSPLPTRDPRVVVLDAARRGDELPQKGKSFQFAAKNLRELALLAYFGDGGGGTLRPPWRVSLDTVRVVSASNAVPDSEVLRVLNGGVVGLLEEGGGEEERDIAADSTASGAHGNIGSGVAVTQFNPTSRCFGLGIVRAATADTVTGEAELFVSTPVRMAELCPRVIAVSEIQLPEAMLTPGGPYLSDFPTGGGRTIGGQVRKARRNLGRKHAPAPPRVA